MTEGYDRFLDSPRALIDGRFTSLRPILDCTARHRSRSRAAMSIWTWLFGRRPTDAVPRPSRVAAAATARQAADPAADRAVRLRVPRLPQGLRSAPPPPAVPRMRQPRRRADERVTLPPASRRAHARSAARRACSAPHANASPDRHAVVIGSGITGLAAARVLVRPRRARDHPRARRRARGADAGARRSRSWQRKGAPQVRHSHAFLGRLRSLLRDRYPDLLDGAAAPPAPPSSTCSSARRSRCRR